VNAIVIADPPPRADRGQPFRGGLLQAWIQAETTRLGSPWPVSMTLFVFASIWADWRRPAQLLHHQNGRQPSALAPTSVILEPLPHPERMPEPTVL